MNKAQTQMLNEIAIKIGLAASEASKEFLPRVAAAIESTDRTISFGVNVILKQAGHGTVSCQIKPRSPKIPTPEMEPTPIMLKLGNGDQLELLFNGSQTEMEAAAEEAGDVPDDGYEPGENSRTVDEAASGEAAASESAASSQTPTGAGEQAPVH